ncbi:MAG: hypothetical protein ABIH24_04175 [Verrucomicrobiota bacterium]
MGKLQNGQGNNEKRERKRQRKHKPMPSKVQRLEYKPAGDKKTTGKQTDKKKLINERHWPANQCSISTLHNRLLCGDCDEINSDKQAAFPVVSTESLFYSAGYLLTE